MLHISPEPSRIDHNLYKEHGTLTLNACLKARSKAADKLHAAPRRGRALGTGRRCRPAFRMPAVLRERRFCAQDGDGMRGFAAPSVLYREGGS